MAQVASKRKHDLKARKHVEMCERELLEQIGLPKQFSPTIDVYLRPATMEDAGQVAGIYNHYVKNSHITEDQEPVSPEDVAGIICTSQQEALPFIVAVLGVIPDTYTRQTSRRKPQNAMVLVREEIVGFTFAETFNFGWGGNRKGRSRYTANLQLYVSPHHVRHGIGRNLLDRLLVTLKSTYSFMDACAWVNPGANKVYETGGAGKWHQLLFQLPILKVDDPNLSWVEGFLKTQFFFKLENIQRSWGRTKAGKGVLPSFTDTAIFQVDSLQEEEYFD